MQSCRSGRTGRGSYCLPKSISNSPFSLSPSDDERAAEGWVRGFLVSVRKLIFATALDSNCQEMRFSIFNVSLKIALPPRVNLVGISAPDCRASSSFSYRDLPKAFPYWYGDLAPR